MLNGIAMVETIGRQWGLRSLNSCFAGAKNLRDFKITRHKPVFVRSKGGVGMRKLRGRD